MHTMSAPDPAGAGARAAMQEALTRAGVQPADIDYLNLHGTATEQNDAMESRAVADLLGHDVPVSSTKPQTGHTLGAAGAVEAALMVLTMTDNPRGRPAGPLVGRRGRSDAAAAARGGRGRVAGPGTALRDEQFVRLRRQQQRAGDGGGLT